MGTGIATAERDPKAEELAEEEIVERIFEAVIDQRLPPGMKLSEAALCEAFGVGRMRIRQSLLLLSSREVVELQPNRGAFVASPSAEQAREVFETRLMIEPNVARLAAERATPADIELLRLHSKEEHQALEAREYGRSLRLSGLFHVEIARISGQKTLLGFVDQLVARSALIIALYWKRERARCDSQSHARLIEALAAGDADEAETQMRTHLLDIHSALHFEEVADDRLALRDMLLADPALDYARNH